MSVKIAMLGAVLAGGLALPAGGSIHAADSPVTFRVEGIVNDVTGETDVEIGDTYVLDYTFDPGTEASFQTQIFATYPATESMSLTIGGYSVTGSAGTLSVADNYLLNQGYGDQYRADFQGLAVAEPIMGLAPLSEVFLQLTAYEVGAFPTGITGLAIPVTPPDLTQFSNRYLALVFGDPGCDPSSPSGEVCPPSGYVIASVDSVSLVADADGNGIDDVLEPEGTPDGGFTDGVTFGVVLSGDGVVVEDLEPGGVRVTTGDTSATLQACGGFTLTLAPNSTLEFTCGSITVEVITGFATVDFDGGLYTLTVPAGGKANVSGGDGVPFTVQNQGSVVVVTVTDPTGNEVEIAAGESESANTSPSLDAVTVPIDPIRIGTTVAVTISVSDPDAADEANCTLHWGDGVTSEVGALDGTCTFERDDLEAGVYSVTGSVTDDQGLTDSGAASAPLVIYDPDGGFVTGGGWFDSPAGAYSNDPTLVGKATFGFVSKYKKGTTVPTGNTEFQMKAGDLNFKSTNYEWLVVTGSDYARFKGTGTINGEGEYTFMIWAGDRNPDTFRIKISDNTGVAYDNGTDQPIRGGRIVVHTS